MSAQPETSPERWRHLHRSLCDAIEAWAAGEQANPDEIGTCRASAVGEHAAIRGAAGREFALLDAMHRSAVATTKAGLSAIGLAPAEH